MYSKDKIIDFKQYTKNRKFMLNSRWISSSETLQRETVSYKLQKTPKWISVNSNRLPEMRSTLNSSNSVWKLNKTQA